MKRPVVLNLALRDLTHGWQSSICIVAATAAALAPVLILFGLYFGIISNMISTLTEDPRVREITLVGEDRLDQGFFDDLRDDPNVAFVQPRTAFLASIVRLKTRRDIIDVNLFPTADGDPLLAEGDVPQGYDQIALSEFAAIDLDAKVGDVIEMRFGRGDDGAPKRHELTVVSIVPSRWVKSDAAFVSVPLLSAVEAWRQGFEVPALGWEGDPAPEMDALYSGFRLYAEDVRSVPPLVERLKGTGENIKSDTLNVEKTLLLEDALGLIFLIVTLLASIGYATTLSLHLAASVVEKSRELSMLRLLGMSSREISILPSIQGASLAGVGALLAGATVYLVQPIINSRLEGLAGLEGRIFVVSVSHFLLAIAITAVIGILSGLTAGYLAARLEPSQGLRND